MGEEFGRTTTAPALDPSSLARFPEENPDPVLRIAKDGTVLYANGPARARLAPLGVEQGGAAPLAFREAAARASRERGRIQCEIECGGAMFLLSVAPVGTDVNVYAQDITARKRVEESLRRRETDLARAQAAVHLGNWRWDLATDTLSWSEELYRIFGVDPAAFVPSNAAVSALLHPEDRDRHAAYVARALAGAPVAPFDARVVRPDGEERVVQASGIEIERDADGRAKALLGTILDITERTRIEQVLRDSEQALRANEARMTRLAARQTFLLRLSDALRPLGDASEIQDAATSVLGQQLGVVRVRYYETDPDGEYVTTSGGYANGPLPTVERLRVDDFGRHVAARCREGRTLAVPDVCADPRLGAVERRTYESLGCRAFVAVPLVKDGRLLAVLAVAHDQPRAWSDEDVALVHEVAERTWAAVERARAEQALLSADRRKSEFLAILSHELRNPLAPIRNSLYLLDHAGGDLQRTTRAREIIRRQTEHLTRLVDDLLDVTRIERGKIELRRSRVDVCGVVRRACDDHRRAFQARGVELQVGAAGPIWADADETRLAQVVGNLLVNAVKFSRERGTVTVDVRCLDDRAEIRVADDGLGIAPELLPHVFEPFVQGEGRLARTRGGLGLGLALVKGIVELHGGRVAARSAGPGRGSEFEIALPVAPAPPPRRAMPAPSVTSSPRTILVIEDDADTAFSIAEILGLEGHRVEVATDGSSGISRARELRPDVVLCDIGLPDVSGYEVARTLRAECGRPSPRLIAVSGFALSEDLQRARAAGFDAHLAKPASLDDLLALVGAGDGAGRPGGPA